MRETLQFEDIENIRSQLKMMLKLSKEEYKIKDLGHFQQASEKLYKVMIHIIELKSGYNIRRHIDIFDTFYWQKAGFHISTMTTFTSNMNLLHSYFYEGGAYPTISVDRVYNNLLKYVDGIIDRI